MGVLKNNLNIKDLFVYDPNHSKSIEFCYLFLTSLSFRQKSDLKQKDSIDRLRKNIGKQLQDILNNDKNSRAKEKILSYPNGSALPDRFLDPEHVLGDEFVFVMESLVKVHSFVMVVNDFFVASQPIGDQSKLLVVMQRGKNAFYPVYLKRKNTNTTEEERIYVLDNTYDTIQLIESFHVNKSNELPSPKNRPSPKSAASNDNDSESDTDAENASEADDDDTLGAPPNKRARTVVQREDVIFDDFDDELIVNYHNQNASIKFTTDEEILFIQNLLMSAEKSEKATGQLLHELIAQSETTSAGPTRTESIYDMRTVPVSTADKLLEDYNEYLENFAAHSERYVTPYIHSVYSSADTNSNAFPIDGADTIRNSFTATFELWRSEEDDNLQEFDKDSCTSLSKNFLDRVLAKFKIAVPKRMSREKACDILLNHNFLATAIKRKLADQRDSKAIVREIADALPNVPKTVRASADKTLTHVIRFAYKQLGERVDLRKLLTKEDMLEVAETHTLTDYFEFDSMTTDDMFDTLSSADVLSINMRDVEKNKKETVECKEDDIRSLIDLSVLSPHVESATMQRLQMFKPIRPDNIAANGFYYDGAPSSTQWVVFDLENYFNILHNIQAFVPLKCSVRYHTSFDEIEGTIEESLEQNDILKIRLINNQVLYYNLSDVHDNRFFVYPEIYEGYRFFKGDLSRNIFFKTNKYSLNEMRTLVALSMQEYVQLFDVSIETFQDLKTILQRFNVSLYAISAQDHATLSESVRPISRSRQPTKSPPASHSPKRLTSTHTFLQFNDENIPDTHKMVLLHKQDYYNKIYDACVAKYSNHSRERLDALVTRPPPRNESEEGGPVLVDIPLENNTRPNSFEELVRYKELLKTAREHNNDIYVAQRQNESSTYTDDLKDKLTEYRSFVERLDTFFGTPHEKQFVKEMFFTKAPARAMKGSETSSATLTFKNTTPTSMHAPLNEDANAANSTIPKDNSILSKMIQLAGAPIEPSEIVYILSQTRTVYMPKLLQMKMKNTNNVNKNDLSIWSNFSQIVLYGAFITIFTQYKHKINTPLFKHCRSRFSLKGFPMDPSSSNSDSSFVRYVACIAFSLFGKQNRYFQSENNVEKQISSYIKLIFQNNSVIKQLFEARAKEVLASKTTKTPPSHMVNFKPYYGANDITRKIQNDMQRSNATDHHHLQKGKDYRVHTIRSARSGMGPLSKHEKLFQLVCNRPSHKPPPTLLNEFTNVQVHPPMRDSTVQSADSSADNDYDEQVSGIITNFQNELGIDLQSFVDTFVLQNKPNVQRYVHLLKLNALFDILLTRYPNMFEEHVELFRRYSVVTRDDTSERSVMREVLHMFDTIQTLLGELVDTDNIYTFLNISIDEQKRRLFTTVLAELKQYLHGLVEKFDDQNIVVDELKRIKEVLREERKQQKLRKYDGIDDDTAEILRILERDTGMQVDTDKVNINQERPDDSFAEDNFRNARPEDADEED